MSEVEMNLRMKKEIITSNWNSITHIRRFKKQWVQANKLANNLLQAKHLKIQINSGHPCSQLFLLNLKKKIVLN